MDSPDRSDNDARRPTAAGAADGAPQLGQPSTTRSSESKPRLSKEAQDLLERHFAAEPKPSTNTKKGFAGELGVPLDKINNWFQNRRAKVKQDAKKARNQQSYDLFYHNGYSTDGLNTESFINPSFYTTLDPGMPHPMLVNDPGMQMAPEMLIAPFQNGPQLIHPPSAPPSFPAYAAYNPNPELGAFFGLDDGSLHNGGHVIDPRSVAAFGNQFKQAFPGTPGASGPHIDGYDDGSTLYAIHSNDSGVHFHPAHMGQMALHANARHPSSSMNSMTTGYSANSRTSSQSWHSPSDAEAPHMPFNLRNLRERMDSIHAGNSVNQMVQEEPIPDFDALHPSSDEPSSLSMPEDSLTATTAAFDFQRNLTIDTSLPQTCAPSALTYQTTEGSTGSRSDKLSPGFSSSSEAGPSPTNTVIPRDSTSSLAARRQKRPAALGITSMNRSVSYNSQVPNSPGSAALAPEQASLRRIKSSNYVMTGRIQKSGLNAVQRSPMSLTFKESDGTHSPRVPRHLSSASRLADHSESGTHSIAEHDAEDMADQDGDMDASSIWNQMPSTAGTAYSSAVWSHAPTTGESLTFTSPPPTPHELLSLQDQMRMRNGSMPNMSHMIPSSAPPWQDSFNLDQPTAMGGPPDMAIHHQMAFRPSTAGEDMMPNMVSSGPGFVQMLPNGMIASPPHVSSGSAVPPGHIPMFPMQPEAMGMMPPPASIISSNEHLSGGKSDASELHIQAYEPREIPDVSDMPPKRMSTSHPKNYQFNNQFAKTFVSPSSN